MHDHVNRDLQALLLASISVYPLTSVNIFCVIAAETPYAVTVKALNLPGCGKEQQIYCFTQEGGITLLIQFVCANKSHLFLVHFLVPPPPENVIVERFELISIGVSWTKFTVVELKGLANYIVT